MSGIKQNGKKAFCCFSGGKDSILSFYKARQSGIEVSHLLNMAAEDKKHSRSHGLSSACLKAQADAMGLPLVQGYAAWGDYENEFKRVVRELKESGINTGIFGDSDLQEHRDWVERVCCESRIDPVLPLWKMPGEEIMAKFVDAGFEAVVCSVNTRMMGAEWLGRRIDKKFISDLKKCGDIDLCGEKGEYHSFVFNGPVFNRKLEIVIGEKTERKNGSFIDIKVKT